MLDRIRCCAVRRASTPTPTDDEVTVMTTDDSKAAKPSEDTKARFREALEKKNAASHPTAGKEGNTGQVHGSETAGPVQKMFRRKSG
jgi:hypothetical protein